MLFCRLLSPVVLLGVIFVIGSDTALAQRCGVIGKPKCPTIEKPTHPVRKSPPPRISAPAPASRKATPAKGVTASKPVIEKPLVAKRPPAPVSRARATAVIERCVSLYQKKANAARAACEQAAASGPEHRAEYLERWRSFFEMTWETLYVGDVLTETQRLAAKEADLTAVYAMDGVNSEALFLRGNIRLKERKYAEAAKDYALAIELNPTNWDRLEFAHSTLGRAKIGALEFKEAIPILEKAITLNPKRVDNYRSLGEAHFYLKDFDAAIAACERGLANYSEDDICREGIKNVRAAISEYERDVETWTRAIAAERTAYNLTGRAREHIARYRYGTAIVDLDEATSLDAKFLPAWFNRGKANIATAKYAAAVADLTRVVEIDGTYFNAYLERGRAYLGAGEKANALSDAERFVALRPNDPNGYLLRADVHLAAGDTSAADRDRKEAARLAGVN